MAELENGAALKARVDILEVDMRAMKAGQGTRWSTLLQAAALALAVVSTVGGIAIWPLVSALQEIKADMVPRVELDARRDSFNARIAENASRIAALSEATVPRLEMTERWRAEDGTNHRLQEQIDDIERQFGSAYSLNDTIKNLQGEIVILRNRLWEVEMARRAERPPVLPETR